MTSEQAARVRQAFPTECQREVAVVLAVLQPGWHISTNEIDPVTVRGETLRIFARLYCAEPAPGKLELLTAPERLVARCLFTRHHDGYVRERAVNGVVAQAAHWTSPFVLQLLGEYVVEIVRTITEGLLPHHEAPYAEFLCENPGFWRRTRHQVVSYWDCYCRREFPEQTHYPASQLVTRLEKWRQDFAATSRPTGG